MDQCHLYLDLCLSFKRKKVEVSLLVIFQNTIIIWVTLHSLGSWCLDVTSTNTGGVLHWVEAECCTHPRRLRRNTHDPRASLRGQLREELTQTGLDVTTKSYLQTFPLVRWNANLVLFHLSSEWSAAEFRSISALLGSTKSITYLFRALAPMCRMGVITSTIDVMTLLKK